MRKLGSLEIDNEGDLLDLVLESPQDLESLRFKWKEVNFDMGNDGLGSGNLPELFLNSHMEFLSATLPNLSGITFTLFPSPMVILREADNVEKIINEWKFPLIYLDPPLLGWKSQFIFYFFYFEGFPNATCNTSDMSQHSRTSTLCMP